MVKLVVRICMFFIIFAFILSFLGRCTDSVLDRFLDDFLNPIESVKGKDYITDDDIANASPIEYSTYVGIKMSQYNQLYISYNTTNINIKPEITHVNVLIESCNQSITEQNSYVNKTKIDQIILIQWVNENKSKINTLKEKYDILKNKIDNLKSEIKKLRSDVKSLESAMRRNENKMIYGPDGATNTTELENYKTLQKELNENINKLLEKIENLEREVAANNRLLKKLKQSIDRCTRELKKINEKLDKLIEQNDVEDETYYFIIGTEDDLKSKGLITSGGLFGGLKVTPSPNKELFALLTDKDKTIPLGKEDAEYDVLSDIPADSYEYRTVNKVKVLIIKDAKTFWSRTEFLIIKQSEELIKS